MMAVAKTLMELKTERDLYLFDTFQGMPPPTAADVDLHGVHADVLLKTNPMTPAIAPFEEVSRHMFPTGLIAHALTSFGAWSRTPFRPGPG
jgi:O-methyltransferase